MEEHTDLIDFSNCDLKKHFITENEILEILPNVRTKINNVKIIQEEVLQITFIIGAKSEQEFKEWLNLYEEKSLATYSISTTPDCAGKRLLFKQLLHCQHNTQCRRIYEPEKNNRTRNTNCPANLTVKIRAVSKRKYQGKDPNAAPNPSLPCEIVAITSHNHKLGTADSLRFRAVSEETKNRLINYYKNGHTPSTALKSLKSEIQLMHNDYEVMLADRRHCPDYNYCYYIFRKEFKAKYEPLEFNSDGKQLLKNRLIQPGAIYDASPDEALPVEDRESVLNKGRPICRQIASTIEAFLENSPHEVLPAITTGLNKMLKMNASAFASAFINLGSEFRRRNRMRRISIQSTAPPRRKSEKKNLGRQSQVGGRPRKTTIILKNKKRNLSNKSGKHAIRSAEHNYGTT